MYDLVLYQQLANALPDLLINLVDGQRRPMSASSILGLDLNAMLVSGIIVIRLMVNVSTVQRAIQETPPRASTGRCRRPSTRREKPPKTFAGEAVPTLSDACRFDRVTFSYGASRC